MLVEHRPVQGLFAFFTGREGRQGRETALEKEGVADSRRSSNKIARSSNGSTGAPSSYRNSGSLLTEPEAVDTGGTEGQKKE